MADGGGSYIIAIEFREEDVNELRGLAEFDLIYVRLLLTHVRAPEQTLESSAGCSVPVAC
jgi:hypothetical protein